MSALDPVYVEARRVLLDALTALASQGPALIVAGAQAVYLRTGEADFAVAPYTTDGDLALDPSLLSDEPQLESAMCSAGFELHPVEPGIWHAPATILEQSVSIPIDLIVPEGAATGGGRRGARLGVHGHMAARRAVGLEAALVDHSTMAIGALDTADQRSVEVEVAGAAALLVAKAHKLHDRVGGAKSVRIEDKDALDVVRLMQATDPATVGRTLAALSTDATAGGATREAVGFLEELFAVRGREGIRMAARALRLAMPEPQVELLSVSYLGRMLEAVR